MMHFSPLRSFLPATFILFFALPIHAQENLDCETHLHADSCVEINEVVVTGLTGTTKMKHSPTPVSVVNASDLRRLPSANIIDAIASQPGLAQITTGAGISKPVIRGLGFNRVVSVIDGIRQEGQQWGEEHGLEMDGENVSTVEILKGPASLRYGSDAMAGVIIFHDVPMLGEDGIRSTLSAEYQTNNGLFDYSAFLQGRKKRIFWSGRWTQKLAHAYKNKYDGYVVGSQYREEALSGTLGFLHRIGQASLRFSAYHTSPGIVEGERDSLTGRLEVPYASYRLKTYGHPATYQQIHHYKVVADNSLSLGAGTLKTTLAYQQNRRHEYEDYASALNLHLHTVNYDIHCHLPLADQWKIVAGAAGMWQLSLNRGEEFLIPDYRLFDVGLFATASYDAARWHVSGGLRVDRRSLTSFALQDEGQQLFDRFSRRFNALSGSLGAIYNLSPQWNLRLNLSRGFRAPNISELAANGEHEGALRFERGNANLRAEHSWQTDFGVDFSSHFLSAQAAFFVNRIENYIFLERTAATMPDTDLPIYDYRQGDAVLFGSEWVVSMHPFERFHFDNNFGFVIARQMHRPSDSRYLPFVPAPRWNCQVRYELPAVLRLSETFSIRHLELTAGTEVNFRQNRFLEEGGTETATPSYTLLNAGISADIFWGKTRRATFQVAGNNLTDCAYQNHLSRLKYADTNLLTGRQGVFNMGRNIMFKLTLYPF